MKFVCLLGKEVRSDVATAAVSGEYVFVRTCVCARAVCVCVRCACVRQRARAFGIDNIGRSDLRYSKPFLFNPSEV